MDHEQRKPPHSSDCPADFNEFINQLPVFAYVASLTDRNILCAGRRASDLLGYDAEEVSERRLDFFDAITHPNDLGHHRPCDYSQLADGEVVDRDLRMRHIEGHWLWVRRREVVIERDAQQNPTKILGTAEDVTNQKLSEQHLVRHHERLLQLLAYEIHDGLVQDIVGAQMAAESVIATVGTTEVDCGQELILLRGLLQKAIGEGRRMITTLRPMIIDEMGVVEAINYLVAEEESTQRLKVTFTHDVLFDRLSPILEGVIFRIVQEALNNVRRHAGTKQAEVRLKQTDTRLAIEVEDHGVGFAPDEVDGKRFGIEGIRERARLFGGKATVKSKVGEGTTVTVVLPAALSPEWDDDDSMSGY